MNYHVTMPAKDLLELLLSDWKSEYKKNKTSLYYFHKIDNLYGFFFIEQNFPKEERNSVYKAILLEFLKRQISERNHFFSLYKNSSISKDEINRLNESENLTNIFYQNLISMVTFDRNENIIEFFSFYNQPHVVSYFDEEGKHHLSINSKFLSINFTIDLLQKFKADNHTLPPDIIQKLKEFKQLDEVKSSDWHLEKIEQIFHGTHPLHSDEPEKKVLEPEKLTKDKKWKWLQDYPITFIKNKAEFFELIVELSRIDYFDKFEIHQKHKDILTKIEPVGFESFILDIHAQTNEEAGKRSQWFVGDKVIAYQIFVWILFEIKAPNRYAALTRIAEKCFLKIPNVGPVSRKLGDCVLKLLYQSQTTEGLGTLLKLKSRNKYPVFLEELDKSIVKAAKYARLNPDDVEDFFISDYGLKDGITGKEFGEYQSTLQIFNYDNILETWNKSDKAIKSVPAPVKSNFSNELKTWKSTIQDIKKEISGQKIRLENFWKKKKQWEYSAWKKYFFDHELLKFITRKLIWQFETSDGIKNGFLLNGVLIDSKMQPLTRIENAAVSLWHPALSSVDEVHEWRSLMITHEIKQPFKQAFREIYLVTGAEINTSTYSNRFNSHVIRHHKFVALAQQRLWTYSISDLYSGAGNPSIRYPEFNIQCTFDLENNFDFATTRQIHFRDTAHNLPVRMEDVPILIFSETMRDADLFVSVCSIGIEEEVHQQYMSYWHSYSTSALTETAKIRKEVLLSVIPKLKIRNVCEFTEKYLIVTGKKRIYKIHLGSGNILMEPNDEYLCIVPDSSKNTENLFLPFEGDIILSVIISKALLLADDDQITDRVILDQINKK